MHIIVIIVFLFLVFNWLKNSIGRQTTIDMVINDVQQHIHQDSLILDLGGGSGLIYESLTKRGFNVKSVDIASKHPHVQIYDGYHLPFPDDTFDACVCIYVLHHVPHTQQLLDEVRRVCKKNAIFLLYEDVPPSNFIGYLQTAFHFIWFKQHPRMVNTGIRTDTQWKQQLYDSNWSVVDAKIYPGQWHYCLDHIRYICR